MRFFTCVIDRDGQGISNRVRRGYEALPRQRGLDYHWQEFENAAVLTAWDDAYGDPLVARGDDWFAVGVVRLDNRPEVERWLRRANRAITDLELVGTVIAEHGTRYVPRLLGDFGFIAWNSSEQAAVAACDAFAVQRLYYSEYSRLIVFSSRAEALATDDRYEMQYLMEKVSLRPQSRNITAYAGVSLLPPATRAVIRPQRATSIQQYWSPYDQDIEPSWAFAEDRAIETCRQLLAESVRLRMGRNGETWAQLSGGIDSSSVVSCAQWLAERGGCTSGLAGTVTFVEQRGSGTDERQYSNAVVNRWKVPNTTIVDPPAWFDSPADVPHIDQPDGSLQVYPRDRRQCAIVRGAGGRILLTGMGGDQLFSGTMLFLADWIARGHVSAAIREMARRAAIGRVSFWQLAYRNALLPMLPRHLHVWLVRDQFQVPTLPWLQTATMKRSGLAAMHAVTANAYSGPRGQKYQHCVAWLVDTIENHYHGGIVADVLDVRHPMLYRPLVEFALRLPQELRARPHAHRWVLRQAMKGILPDEVRARVGKPSTSDYLAWSLRSDREQLAPLVRDPLLADLGLVEPAKLQAAFHAALHGTTGGDALCGPLLNTLALEMWLRIRSGRWPISSQFRSWS
jgi:asparagine synthase (glutamine-hydrolysing)